MLVLDADADADAAAMAAGLRTLKQRHFVLIRVGACLILLVFRGLICTKMETRVTFLLDFTLYYLSVRDGGGGNVRLSSICCRQHQTSVVKSSPPEYLCNTPLCRGLRRPVSPVLAHEVITRRRSGFKLHLQDCRTLEFYR